MSRKPRGRMPAKVIVNVSFVAPLPSTTPWEGFAKRIRNQLIDKALAAQAVKS